jgi:hypothetical protein
LGTEKHVLNLSPYAYASSILPLSTFVEKGTGGEVLKILDTPIILT